MKKILALLLFLLPLFHSPALDTVFAADRQAYPKPYITCSQQSDENNLTNEDDEWHSLRPYQASPCKLPNQENFNEQALLCGSDLIVRDDFHPNVSSDILNSSCRNTYIDICLDPFATRQVTRECDFDMQRTFTIETDAYNSELPIAGQTELVKGSEPGLLLKVLETYSKLPLTPDVVQEHRLEDFNSQQPPELTDYVDYRDYYAAYQEWRGKNCWQTPTHITVPIIGKTIPLPAIMLCGELNGGFLKANFWSELYPKIPYSSTEDRIGKYTVSDMIWVPDESDPDIKQINPLVTGWLPKADDPRNEGTANNEGVLFFPHMEENLETTSLLQSTYLPKDLLEQEQKTGNDVTTDTPNDKCTILNVRKNPGDQLFGERLQWAEGTGEGRPAAKVKYTAHFTCTVKFDPNSPKGCVIYPDPLERKGPDYNCNEWTYFYSDVSTNTPLIDEIWNKTVAGEASVLRRFFPRSGSDPLTKIQDLPTETDVVYKVNDKTGGVGRALGQGAKLLTLNPKLYFPHLGGIHKYFLNGIQSMIRPKDFPAKQVSLSDTALIPETTQANEYLSWFLNGTLERAEQDPLDIDTDTNRIITLTGPLNKLLSQHSQWRNTTDVSRVAQTEDAKANRHNQIAGCTIGVTIPFTDIEIGGFPVMCETQSQEDLPSPAPSGSGEPTSCKYPSDPSQKDTIDASCKLTPKTINGIPLPDNMRRVFEAAGAKNGVPPDLIAGVMFSEGGFEPRVANPSCYGEYSEENIDNAIKCEFPNCNPDTADRICNYDSTQGPGSCTNGGTHFGPYQQCPNNYNPCNFYDATMAAAAKLARDKSGLESGDYPDSGDGSIACIGYNYNTGSPSGSGGCQKSGWSCSDVVTAIRFETGSCIPAHFCDVLKIYGQCDKECGNISR